MDIDPIELGRKVAIDLVITCHLKFFLEKLSALWITDHSKTQPQWQAWKDSLKVYRQLYPTGEGLATAYGIRGIGVKHWNELVSVQTTISWQQYNDPLLERDELRSLLLFLPIID